MKISSISSFAFIVCFLLLVPITVVAEKGTSHGGGASDIVADFRELAERIIHYKTVNAMILFFSREEADLLKKGLKECRIIRVPKLLNPATEVEIPNQRDLIAWGSKPLNANEKGIIQLKIKTDDPSVDSWEARRDRNMPMAHHIIHELFRCVGAVEGDGKTPLDDDYKFSMDKHELHRLPILSHGDISSFDCFVHYRSGRHTYDVQEARRIIDFNSQPSASVSVNLNSIRYSIDLKKTQRGVLVSAHLTDKISQTGTTIESIYFKENNIHLDLHGARHPPDMDSNYWFGPTSDLALICWPKSVGK